MRTIIPRNFLYYKFFNSLFLGISLGSIFTIYAPLEPSVYSLGGIALALCMLFVAKLYHKILTIDCFFKISLAVELAVLLMVGSFLLLSYSYTTALIVYIAYQLTFTFGSYLPRAETLFLKKIELLSFLDIAKQKGYLAGMFLSYMFYKSQEFLNIYDKELQVYNMHFLLLITQLFIIAFLVKSFKNKEQL